MARRGGGLVYSSGQGRMCPTCERPHDACVCQKASAPAAGGPVRVGRETKGRKGGGVTVVTGLPLAAGELKALAKELKARCGVGGTVKGGTIELQGDKRDRVVELLVARGFAAKRSGG
jgi:translation initiation factor 1